MKYHADPTFDAYQKERLLNIPDYDYAGMLHFVQWELWKGCLSSIPKIASIL